jgi:hypothetical protein
MELVDMDYRFKSKAMVLYAVFAMSGTSCASGGATRFASSGRCAVRFFSLCLLSPFSLFSFFI